ncbi:MAG: hypothetical protein Q7K71_04870 [Candidatus Omnitrophota bacterium]|nr:hypothetical protein [Candidatus Omnitrophota bacterium]
MVERLEVVVVDRAALAALVVLTRVGMVEVERQIQYLVLLLLMQEEEVVVALLQAGQLPAVVEQEDQMLLEQLEPKIPEEEEEEGHQLQRVSPAGTVVPVLSSSAI